MLSVAVARDNATPYLEAAEVRALLAATLGYLAREQDVRGYDDEKGWMHSAAHTADLLKFLARSRHLPAGAQREILDAIAAKMRDAPVALRVRRGSAIRARGVVDRQSRGLRSTGVRRVGRPRHAGVAEDGASRRGAGPRQSEPDAICWRSCT